MTGVASEGDGGAEMRALRGALDGQRRHVLGILDGLDGALLRRPALPSGWHPLGLVQHLALDVEEFWFAAVVAGDQDVIRSLEQRGDAWQVPEAVGAEDVRELYRRVTAEADAALADVAPDAPLAWWPHEQFTQHLFTVREVVLHVITETACHAGHLDAARELIDGQRWLVLN